MNKNPGYNEPTLCDSERSVSPLAQRIIILFHFFAASSLPFIFYFILNGLGFTENLFLFLFFCGIAIFLYSAGRLLESRRNLSVVLLLLFFVCFLFLFVTKRTEFLCLPALFSIFFVFGNVIEQNIAFYPEKMEPVSLYGFSFGLAAILVLRNSIPFGLWRAGNPSLYIYIGLGSLGIVFLGYMIAVLTVLKKNRLFAIFSFLLILYVLFLVYTKRDLPKRHFANVKTHTWIQYHLRAALTGVQPGNPVIKTLLISDDFKFAVVLKKFPLTAKMIHLPSARAVYSSFLSNVKTHFDLIIIQVPPPDNIASIRFYYPELYSELKNLLTEEGTLALFFSGLSEENHYDATLYQKLLPELKKDFPYISVAPGKDFILFCSNQSPIILPDALLLRQQDLLDDFNYLPFGVLALLNTEEEIKERNFIFRQLLSEGDKPQKNTSLIAGLIPGYPCPPQLKNINLFSPSYIIAIGILLLLLCLIRYFYFSEHHKKCFCLTVESGFYFGILSVFLLLGLQLSQGFLFKKCWLDVLVFFISFLIGCRIGGISWVSRCIAGIAFLTSLFLLFFPEVIENMELLEYICFAGIIFLGFFAGIRMENTGGRSAIFLSASLVSGSLTVCLFFVRGGWQIALFIAILTVISPLLAEKFQKKFEKNHSASNLP